MEIFGYFILIIFAILGLGALVLFSLPFIISFIKTSSYRVSKQIEVAKIDIDARAEAKKLRNEKLRNKQNELAEKKVTLKIKKLQSKIDSIDKDMEIQESLKVKETEEVKEDIVEEVKVEEVTPEVKIDTPEPETIED